MTRYLMMYTPDKDDDSPEHRAKVGAYAENLMKAGTLVSMGALLPPSSGGRVKQTGGKVTVTDGPFPETKEMIVGWAVLNAATRDDAMELAKAFLRVAGDGEIQVRAMAPGTGDP
jgi:hypothetical protein